ncbi:antibiotic biosynthesis monooxygenase [Pseudomonas sp. WN033]|nr:antibiotic biosynthesis monooxygenase [Pseudomonas sp. WN033]
MNQSNDNSGDSSSHGNQGASIIIRHQVSPDNRNRYETWLRQIITTAARFPGHQGVHILRPVGTDQTFEIAVRFSSQEQAQNWLDSDQRRELIADIRPILTQTEHIEIHSGIDFWFTPPTAQSKQPTRWKQWLVTTAVIWPLTMLVPLAFQPLFRQVPVLSAWGISHGLIAATIVGLVVYVIMPRVVRLVAGWLFR